MKKLALAACVCALSLGAAAQTSPPATTAGDNQPEPLVLLVPVQVKNPALDAGCWAQLYDERGFKGEMVTIVGPIELQTLDKSTGRHLRRNIDSLTVGPKATLTVFEHRMFKDRSVDFGPNSKEPGVVSKIGATGRIESMRLSCSN